MFAVAGTALHVAARKRHTEIVKLLLRGGADPNVVYEEGMEGNYYTPLSVAAERGRTEAAKLMLDAGADAKSKIASDGCLTALGHALAGGYDDIVKMLVAAGANLNFAPSDFGTPECVAEDCVSSATFVAAAGGGFTDIVTRLLEAGAPANASAGYKGVTTALIAAAANGHVDVVRLLLTAGATLDSQDYNGTALGHALISGHADVVEVLTKAGPKKVRVLYVSGRSPVVITIDDEQAIAALKGERLYQEISIVKGALASYYQDVGRYPPTAEGLKALLQRPPDLDDWNGPYLNGGLPKDPWGNEFHYKAPGEHGEYDLYSLGADNAEGGDGENADIVGWKEPRPSIWERTFPQSADGAHTAREQEIKKMFATLERQIEEYKAKGQDFSDLEGLKGELQKQLADAEWTTGCNRRSKGAGEYRCQSGAGLSSRYIRQVDIWVESLRAARAWVRFSQGKGLATKTTRTRTMFR